MAALNRPVTATYAVNETVRVDTQDNEDHTFCGIMFPVYAKKILPVERIIIQSVAVRGHLGDISVWISNETTTDASNRNSTGQNAANEVSSFKLLPEYWTKVYQKKHKPSQQSYQTMDLTSYETPITLLPGQVRLIYVHSTLESDAAIVYDNASMFGERFNQQPSSSVRYEDDKIVIHTGKAHLSFVPFGEEPIWGWGNAWRERREFVGQIRYGTIYKLWHPERHSCFGRKYHAGTRALLMLQRRNTLFARLPDECIYYILNMCRWDWFEDNSSDMKSLYRRRKSSQREQQSKTLLLEQLSTSAAATNSGCGQLCDRVKNVNNGRVAMDSDDDLNEHAMDDYDDEEAGNEVDEEDGNEDDDDDGNEDDDDDDEEGDSEEDGNDDNDANTWEEHDYRPETSSFVFHHMSSDQEDDDDDDDQMATDDHLQNRAWFGPQAVRQVVVRALGGTTGRGNIR